MSDVIAIEEITPTSSMLAVSGGVHEPIVAVKAIIVGAGDVQVVSALLKHGPAYLRQIVTGFEQWADEHEYESLDQMHGRMSLSRCPDPASFERGNDVRILQSWHRAPTASGLFPQETRQVLRTAPCPVLTVRHPEHEFVVPDAADTTANQTPGGLS